MMCPKSEVSVLEYQMRYKAVSLAAGQFNSREDPHSAESLRAEGEATVSFADFLFLKCSILCCPSGRPSTKIIVSFPSTCLRFSVLATTTAISRAGIFFRRPHSFWILALKVRGLVEVTRLAIRNSSICLRTYHGRKSWSFSSRVIILDRG
jgi:hypothetical protein